VTVPALPEGAAATPALGALVTALALASGAVAGAVVPPVAEELEAVGVEEELLEVLELFFFMFIMKKRPTTRTSMPITAIWTVGLSLSAFLIGIQLPPDPRCP
jgi:hypothetical protein